MSDPIRDLENLRNEGITVNPLPAAEVRRRGTRMRRRNNAVAAVGALAVLAVIATPIAVVARSGDHAGPGPVGTPSPSPTQTVQAGWKQTIPGSFDIAALPADATFSFTARDDSVVDDFTMCGRPTFSTRSNDPVGPASDTAGATYGEPGTDGNAGRTLALYENDQVAAKAVESFRANVDLCPEDTQGTGAPLVYAAVDTDLPADESFVFTQQARMDKDLLADLTVIQVARVGNAIYIATDHTSAGGQQVADAEVRRLAEWSAPVLSDMCVFAAEPCDAASTASPGAVTSTSATPVIGEGPVSVIPDGFPLDQAISVPEGGPLDGPSATAEGVPPLDLCGTSVWPPRKTVERLAVTSTMPQYRESRELVTFARTDDAAAAVTRVSDALRSCSVIPGDTTASDKMVDVQPVDGGDLGADDAVTFSITYREGLGGGVYQIARVGRAVYGTYVDGEFSRDSVDRNVTALSGKTKGMLPNLCPWTEKGC